MLVIVLSYSTIICIILLFDSLNKIGHDFDSVTHQTGNIDYNISKPCTRNRKQSVIHSAQNLSKNVGPRFLPRSLRVVPCRTCNSAWEGSPSFELQLEIDFSIMSSIPARPVVELQRSDSAEMRDRLCTLSHSRVAYHWNPNRVLWLHVEVQ